MSTKTFPNGTIRFSKHKSNKGNPYYPKGVNDAGGMEQFVRGTVSRNMFLILDRFHKLPTEQSVRDLDIATRDWLIESIIYDSKVQKAALEGREITDNFSDNSEEYMNDVYNASGQAKMIADGDDIDDLAEQIRNSTDGDDVDWDAKIDAQIDAALEEKSASDARTQEQIDANIEEATRRAQEKLSFDDDDFDEL